MGILTVLPLRPDGVRATLEFVFAVHPSSSAARFSEASAPQKDGANITQEALAMASQLISLPPSSTSPEAWFSGVSKQLLPLLDGNEGLELTKVASYIIGFGILGRKSTGAPGMLCHDVLEPKALALTRLDIQAHPGGTTLQNQCLV